MPRRSPRTERPLPPPADVGGLRGRLLRWFDANRRDLPWRRRRDPYAVWLSEVMLQQTQVATVVPYFERFLERFPDVHALARAEVADILALWRGLGYYSRARNLHRAAQLLSAQGFPDTAKGLQALPGLGRYTAAAIASLAFAEPVAVLDGNVSRVIARLRAIEGPLGSSQARLWSEAETLLDRDRPGAFNEAMMELGALVCVPGEPRCGLCPLAADCTARAGGLERAIPAPKPRPVRKRLRMACAVVAARGRILLARRAEEGLFGGLWELPSVTVEEGDSGTSALASLGFRAIEEEPFATVRRTLTHRELTLELFLCRPWRGLAAGFVEQRSANLAETEGLGVSKAMSLALVHVEPMLGDARKPTARARSRKRGGQAEARGVRG